MDGVPLHLVIAACAVLYGLRVLFFMVGFLRERAKWQTEEWTPKVSIVVPARNEEDTLQRCVQSLVNVDYPLSLIEIIIIDDRSEDTTAAVLERLAAQYPQLRVIHRAEADVEQGLRGKPGALQQAIDASTGEIILMTDADCRVSPDWVRGMVNQFKQPEVALVAGFTSVQSGRLVDHLQDVEWTYMQAMAAGGVGNHLPFGCFGNNLGVRASAFAAVGGYRKISFSVTEDLALLQALYQAGWTVRYAVHTMTLVETLPVRSLGDYIRQRHRWARGGTDLGWKAAVFVVTSFALWSGVLASLLLGLYLWAILFLAVRVVGDGVLIAMTARAVRNNRMLIHIPWSVVLLMMTELVVPLIILNKRVTWKNQVFHS